MLRSVDELKSAPIGLQAPFDIATPGRETMRCEQIYRHLPGRRLVFRARWHNTDTLVKLFFRARDFDRERAGLRAMAAARIPHGAEIWTLIDAADDSYFLGCEFLDDAVSLQDCYNGLSAKQLLPLLRDALSIVGKLHRAGSMQADIHLDNFLLSRGKLLAIDGGGVSVLQGPVEDNIGLFFAQMVPDYDPLIPDVLDAYGEGVPSLAAVQAATTRMRAVRIARYLQKTVRSCTEFSVSVDRHRFIAMRRDLETRRLTRLMNEPDAEVGGAKFLKRGNTATVIKVDCDGQDRVLKIYNIKNFWHGVSRCWRPSRAWVSWQNAHRLQLLGVATPLPVALRENRVGPLRRVAYLLTDFIDGENLASWLLKTDRKSIPEWLDAEIVRLFDIMWRSHVTHGDMKATNFMVFAYRLHIIDLDSMRWHDSQNKFVAVYRRDLLRFLQNWQGETREHFVQLLEPFARRAGLLFPPN